MNRAAIGWAMLAIIAVGCGGAERTGAAPQRAEPMVGLWGADVDFGPALAGPLEVRRGADGWSATIGGGSARLREEAGEVRGRFEPDGAELRLRRDGDARMVGHWIQPTSMMLSQRFATPIALTGGDGGGYRGVVAPLREEIHHYLVIERRGDGLIGWVRETEKNIGRFLGELRVERGADGSATFHREEDGEVAFTARLVDDDHLELTMADLERPLVHTRRGRDDAPGFYAGPTGRWTYQAPIATRDEWPVGMLGTAGIDEAAIARLVQRIRDAEPTAWRAPAIHALVIARHGRLVLDEYFNGHAAERTHDLRSAGKTIATTLLGIAIDRGILSLDARVSDFVPSTAPADPRRAELRLAHLASMTSGLDCDDRDYDSPGNEDRMQQQLGEPDWYRYMGALPLIRAPGEKGVYCTGAINLLGAALGGTTGTWLPDLFAAWFAAPLAIEHYHVNLMPTGDGYLGGGIRLRTRDLAKLAQLVLGGGSWNGRRVVTAAWLADATAAQTSIDLPDDYGYGWWLRTLRVGDRDVEVVFASGNGGQLAIAVPALDLVIAINGGNYGNYPAWRTFLEEIVPELLAAVR